MRLSAVQHRALGMLLERTGAGEWFICGGTLLRTNTAFALEKRGLARVRMWRMGHGTTMSGYEAQITEAGRQLLAE